MSQSQKSEKEIPYSMEHSRTVRGMFARIARRYDLLNSLMTFGRDRAWRSETVRQLGKENAFSSNGIYLDAGCGTGDLAFELLARYPQVVVVAADLTPEMIQVGRKRKRAEQIAWVVADAEHLPFQTNTFSGLVSGYLLRNVGNLDIALQEQFRVLSANGQMAALDTTRPARNILRPFILIYYKWIIPFLGKMIAGDAAAYKYLPETSARFLDAETLAQRIQMQGFSRVGFVRRMFGTMAIHWGKKL